MQSIVGGKPKIDRTKYMFVKQEGQELVKKPGEIAGQGFKLEQLTNCTVWLMDQIATVRIATDEVSRSTATTARTARSTSGLLRVPSKYEA